MQEAKYRVFTFFQPLSVVCFNIKECISNAERMGMPVGIRNITLEGNSIDVKRASLSYEQLKAERPVMSRHKTTMYQCSQKIRILRETLPSHISASTF